MYLTIETIGTIHNMADYNKRIMSVITRLDFQHNFYNLNEFQPDQIKKLKQK